MRRRLVQFHTWPCGETSFVAPCPNARLPWRLERLLETAEHRRMTSRNQPNPTHYPGLEPAPFTTFHPINAPQSQLPNPTPVPRNSGKGKSTALPANSSPPPAQPIELQDRDFVVRFVSERRGREDCEYLVHWEKTYVPISLIHERADGTAFVRCEGQEWSVRQTTDDPPDAMSTDCRDVEWEPTWKVGSDLPKARDAIAEFERELEESRTPAAEVTRPADAADGEDVDVDVITMQPQSPALAQAAIHSLQFIVSANADHSNGLKQRVREMASCSASVCAWMGMPARQALLFRETMAGKVFDAMDKVRLRACMAHIAGFEQASACEPCFRGGGPFARCVVIGADLANRACTNCAVRRLKNCNFHNERKPHVHPLYNVADCSAAYDHVKRRMPVMKPPATQQLVAGPTTGSLMTPRTSSSTVSTRTRSQRSLGGSVASSSSRRKATSEANPPLTPPTSSPTAGRERSFEIPFDDDTPQEPSHKRCSTDEEGGPPLKMRTNRFALGEASSSRHDQQPTSSYGPARGGSPSPECDVSDTEPNGSRQIAVQSVLSDSRGGAATESTQSLTIDAVLSPHSRHDECGLSHVCKHPRIRFPRASDGRLVLSNKRFESCEASAEEVHFILNCCDCFTAQHFDDMWQAWRNHCSIKGRELGHTKESYLSVAGFEALNNAVEMFCPWPHLSQHGAIVIDDD